MEKIRKSPKRLIIDIDEKFHQQIKYQALKRNITLRRWIYRVISEALKKEEQYEHENINCDNNKTK